MTRLTPGQAGYSIQSAATTDQVSAVYERPSKGVNSTCSNQMPFALMIQIPAADFWNY